MFYDLTNKKEISKNGILAELENKVFGKKSFIAFVHADWCGHCMRMLPEWNKFVDKMKTNKSFDILDVSNETYDFILSTNKHQFFSDLLEKTVSGYPTIFFVSQQKNPKGNESIVHFFSDQRTSSSLIKFVKQFTKKETKKESYKRTKATPNKTEKQNSKN